MTLQTLQYAQHCIQDPNSKADPYCLWAAIVELCLRNPAYDQHFNRLLKVYCAAMHTLPQDRLALLAAGFINGLWFRLPTESLQDRLVFRPLVEALRTSRVHVPVTWTYILSRYEVVNSAILRRTTASSSLNSLGGS